MLGNWEILNVEAENIEESNWVPSWGNASAAYPSDGDDRRGWVIAVDAGAEDDRRPERSH